ncbi:exocyst complex component 3-like protein 4 [Tachyglossus aculeatus]|uniref:exocyst complex component 3-like protein 4 n=1 Tax=Tachyglossus aculeatus TaxID=9261 RepID=UPI0018F3B8CA|nr:exocyst complex component 3-like protein 4 [Tachyglossus aculeatus]
MDWPPQSPNSPTSPTKSGSGETDWPPQSPNSPTESLGGSSVDSGPLDDQSSPQDRDGENLPVLGMLRGTLRKTLTRISKWDLGRGDGTKVRKAKTPSGQGLKENGEDPSHPKSVPDTSQETQCSAEEGAEETSISELIKAERLLEALEGLERLEKRLGEEKQAGRFAGRPTEFARRAMVVCLLYDHLWEKMKAVVQNTLGPAPARQELLRDVAELIGREERAHPSGAQAEADFLSAPRNWRGKWREAVGESVKERVRGMPLLPKEDSLTWLAQHLRDLGKGIREDLARIRRSVWGCYPEDFAVWGVYLDAFHAAISAHLQGLLGEVLEQELEHVGPQDCENVYVVMDWAANVYCSEDFLGHQELKMDMENLPPLLEPQVWKKLECAYTYFLKEKIQACFENIRQLEMVKWTTREQPSTLQDLYHSPLSVDIHMMLSQHANTARAISGSLETTTLQICVQGLKDFIARFGEDFLNSDVMNDDSLVVPYLITYMNTMHELKTSLPTRFQVSFEEVDKAQAELMGRFRKRLLTHLELEIQPLFKNVVTKAWISSDTLEPIMEKVVKFDKHLKHLSHPLKKESLQDVHRCVVRKYIAQILNPKERMSGSDRLDTAVKMSQESQAIRATFEGLGSDASWIDSAIPCLSEILGEKKKDNIKKHIEMLVGNYPDIRREHLVAILSLRKLGLRRKQAILQHAEGLMRASQAAAREAEAQDRMLFAEIRIPSFMGSFRKSMRRPARRQGAQSQAQGCPCLPVSSWPCIKAELSEDTSPGTTDGLGKGVPGC